MRQHSIRALSLAKPYSKQHVKPFDRGKINAEAFVDGTYPLTRRLFVVIRRDGTFDEQAGFAYTNLMLSQEGQRLVEQAGFVPIRN
jgi:phosphate transport system substrate-binding protein